MDHQWGVVDETGSWTGMIGQIIRRVGPAYVWTMASSLMAITSKTEMPGRYLIQNQHVFIFKQINSTQNTADNDDILQQKK